MCPACFVSTEDVYCEGSQSSESRSGCTANCCLHPFDFLSGTESPRWSSPHSAAHKSTRKSRRLNSDNLCLSSPGSAHSPIKSCVSGLKGNTENIFGTLPCWIGERTHIKGSWSPMFWSNGALIYLSHSALIEGLFGQVQHVWQGCNSCHWIKRWGGAERLMREGRWRGFCLSGCHVMYISHKSLSQGDAADSVCISFAGCSTDLVLLGPPLLQCAVYFQPPM